MSTYCFISVKNFFDNKKVMSHTQHKRLMPFRRWSKLFGRWSPLFGRRFSSLGFSILEGTTELLSKTTAAKKGCLQLYLGQNMALHCHSQPRRGHMWLMSHDHRSTMLPLSNISKVDDCETSVHLQIVETTPSTCSAALKTTIHTLESC